MRKGLIFCCIALMLSNCGDDHPFLTGYLRHASDALMTSCDPNNKGALHTCVIYSLAFQNSLVVYNATVEELVLAPMGYFPLKVEVGPATDVLTAVSSANDKFPYFLALDSVEEAIYVIRLFAENKDKPSFAMPLRLALTKGAHKPYRMAAFESASYVVVILTYPGDKGIEFLALDKNTGEFKKLQQKVALGVKPSHVIIDDQGKKAIVSDEGSKDLIVIDLNNIEEVLKDPNDLVHETLPIDMLSNRIYGSLRDFGDGLKYYVAVLKSMSNELRLINITDKKVEFILNLDEHPSALYFPDQGSEPCCIDKKNWLAVMGVKGNLKHIVVKKEGAKLTFNEPPSNDIKSEKNLNLSQLNVIKIVGGKVHVDPALKREIECPNNRKMFFVSSFALDKPFYEEDEEELLGEMESFEVEAQGQSCEGDGTATRLGLIKQQRRSGFERKPGFEN